MVQLKIIVYPVLEVYIQILIVLQIHVLYHVQLNTMLKIINVKKYVIRLL
jgi:hypothetical protein